MDKDGVSKGEWMGPGAAGQVGGGEAGGTGDSAAVLGMGKRPQVGQKGGRWKEGWCQGLWREEGAWPVPAHPQLRRGLTLSKVATNSRMRMRM